ncbi:unnamed protein product, partial [marine sediment metagenome]
MPPVDRPLDLHRQRDAAQRLDAVPLRHILEYAEIVHDVVEQTEWHSDYCIVDMPAGNADIFMTMVLA